MTPVRALLAFHAATSLRVYLGMASLQVTALILAVGLAPEPRLLLEGAARGLAAAPGFPGARLLGAAWALGTALAAARGVARGGWLRHLPAGSRTERRAALLALLGAQALVAAAWTGAWAGAALLGEPLRAAPLLALLPVSMGAAAAALPGSAWTSRGLGLAALILGAFAGAWSLFAAAVLLGIGERRGHFGARRTGFGAARPSTAYLPAVVARRALGGSAAFLVLWSLLAVAAAWLVRRNNPGLDDGGVALAVRAASGAGLVFVLHGAAGRLVTRRPPWPWSRSLPWSSGVRVRDDVMFLGVLAIPALAAAAFVSPRAAAPLVSLGMFLAVRAAAAMRSSAERPTSLGWRLAAEAWCAVFLVSLSAWTGAVLLVLLPVAWRDAVRREARTKVSLLRERHYRATGDPAS